MFVSEHHFSDYQLTSEQMMVLSWIAGQTSRVRLGTFVTVLPWHDPVRVAESFTVLDHLSGRDLVGQSRRQHANLRSHRGGRAVHHHEHYSKKTQPEGIFCSPPRRWRPPRAA